MASRDSISSCVFARLTSVTNRHIQGQTTQCCPIRLPADKSFIHFIQQQRTNCRLFPVNDVILCVDMVCDRRFVLLWLWLFTGASGLVLYLRIIPLPSGVPSSGLQYYVPSLQCRLSGSFCMESCKRTQLFLRCFTLSFRWTKRPPMVVQVLMAVDMPYLLYTLATALEIPWNEKTSLYFR